RVQQINLQWDGSQRDRRLEMQRAANELRHSLELEPDQHGSHIVFLHRKRDWHNTAFDRGQARPDLGKHRWDNESRNHHDLSIPLYRKWELVFFGDDHIKLP